MANCKYCNVETQKLKLGGHVAFCKLNPNLLKNKLSRSNGAKGKRLSEETKQKISEKRKIFLKNNPDKIPYLLNHSSKMSWPEQTVKKYLEEYKVEGWIYNYSFDRFCLDFAFPEWKLDVEIDGNTHLLEHVKKIDLERDKILSESQWKILRFTASEVKNNIYNVIQKIVDELSITKIIEIPVEFLNKKFEKEEKLRIKNKIKKEKDNEKRKKIENINNKIINSNIDFSKFGWVQKVSDLTGIKHQKVNNWMKKYLNNILEKAFKKVL